MLVRWLLARCRLVRRVPVLPVTWAPVREIREK